jgi:lytic cellulose monooxygenase (C1-hydroxylating)
MSSISKNTALLGALTFAAKSAAHGIVTGIVSDGQYNLGYDPAFQYQRPPPTVAGWSIPTVQDRGFVSDLNGADIICHRGATPGGAYVKAVAGGTLEFQWTEWPESHHGPVIDYLAPCPDGDCTNVDKTELKFIKVAEAGLVEWNSSPGKWASDDMIANNNTWVVKIPSDVAPGKYVWRHETIALHSAHESHGAQAYPQCVNLEISGSGSNDMSGGVSAETFYSWEDPGMDINIYYPKVENYIIPGPALMEGGGSSSPQPSSTPSGAPFPSANATVSAGPTDTGTGTSSSAPTTSSKPVRPIGGGSGPRPPYGGQPSASVTITNIPSVPTKDVEPSPVSPSQPEQPPVQPPVQPGNGESSGPGTGVSPISFTSTFTGRIGKPTKFTCYLEE